MSCKQCEKIRERQSFRDVEDYAETVKLLSDMEKAGELEVTYQTCPFDRVFGNTETKEIGFYAKRMFHQVRCYACGQLYGLICDVSIGDGQLKKNDRVFDPDNYKV